MNRRVVLAYFLVELLFYAVALPNNTDEESSPKLFSNDANLEIFQNAESDFSQRKWISQLFHEARMAFRMDPNVNSECKKDFDLYTLHLKNQSMWAIKMMESSEWPLHGILSGTVNHMGKYDECLGISSYGIDGRYCLAEATYNYSDILRSELVDAPDETISAWEAVTMYEKNPTRINRKKLTFAMCIPSSCNPYDLKSSLESTLSPIFRPHRVNISIDVNPILCQTRNEFAYPIGFYIVGSFFIALFLLVLWSTFYDITTAAALVEVEKNGEQKNNLFKEVSKIFSIVRNFREFVTISPKETAALHLPKIVNMLVVVFSHRMLLSIVGYPTSDSIALEQMFRGFMSVLLSRQTPVDVFLFISGFLMFRFQLAPMIKGGKFFLFSSIVLRWIRIFPVYGVLILYIIYILPYTADGPMWNQRMLREADYCRQSWWAGLLGIHNIVKVNQQCLFTTWYISADIQLTIMGGILLYVYTKHKKVGIFVTVLMFVASIVITFSSIYAKHLSGVMMFHPEAMKDLLGDRDYANLYVTTYLRCGPYLMGFIGAYIVKSLKDRNFKLTNKQIYVLLLVFTLLSEATQVYGSVFFTFNRPYDRFESALYGATNRIISITFYIVFYSMYFTSGLGIFTKIFEWKIWILWGRLIYSVYLIGPIIQMYYAFSQREPVSFYSLMSVIWWAIGDVVVCHVLGMIFYLFVEAPLINLRVIVKSQLSRLRGNPEDVKKEAKFVETNCKKNE